NEGVIHGALLAWFLFAARKVLISRNYAQPAPAAYRKFHFSFMDTAPRSLTREMDRARPSYNFMPLLGNPSVPTIRILFDDDTMIVQPIR
ncbi:hypothetical protein V1478_006115, partial [Vespula squamosa]